MNRVESLSSSDLDGTAQGFVFCFSWLFLFFWLTNYPDVLKCTNYIGHTWKLPPQRQDLPHFLVISSLKRKRYFSRFQQIFQE